MDNRSAPRVSHSADAALRANVLELLRGGNAHATFEDATANFPVALRGKLPRGAEHTAWQLVEHLRITQRDILDFSRNTEGGYKSLEWPEGYWPSKSAPQNTRAWTASLKAVLDDRRTFEKLIADPKAHLFKPFPWGKGQTLLREALLMADHSSYHIGQIVLLRRLLHSWRG